ncbi:MAG: hypothetical protein HY566_02690, partial [Candidatus Kerfeldbacteria bacterium]|nr:hypothetical protein [Candidatus Kerfeldbacteria bacterium]
FCKPNAGQVPDSRHNFYTFCGNDTDCIDSPTPNPLTCQAEAPNQIGYRRNIKCPEGIPACEGSGNGIFNQKVRTWDYPLVTDTDYVVTWNEIRYNSNQQHVRVAINGDLFQEFDDIGNRHPLRARPGITSYQPTIPPAGGPLRIEYDDLKAWNERGINVTVDADLGNPLSFARFENSLGWFTFNRGVCASGDPTLLGTYCRVNTDCGPGPIPVPVCSNAASGGVPVAGDVEDWNNASTYGFNRVYAAPQGNCSITTTTACSVPQDCPVGQTCTVKRFPGQVAGWGRFLTLRDYGNALAPSQPNWGWTHLRGGEARRGVCVGGPDNDEPCSAPAECTAPGICDTTLANIYTDVPTGGFQSCLDCSGSVDGNPSNGDPGNGKCNICRNIQMTATATPIIAACSSCYDCNDSYACTTCEFCSSYGVSFHARQAQLVGYAWAGGDMAEGGLGWVEFGPASGAISALQAWLATRYGDIFVRGDIGITTQLPAPPGSFNATYVIQSNGTIAFTSRAGYVQPNYPQSLGLPTRGTQYINILGRLDFKEMSSGSRYGTVVTWPNAAQANIEINAWNSKLLEGKIYYVRGDVTVNNPLTFLPGSGTSSGAGTIIVDGDLTMNAPVTYDTGTPAGTITNIPSVAWLVRGNVTVNPNVGTPKTDLNPGPNIVGAFLVVGCPSDGQYADESSGNPCNVTTQDGQVRTGASSVLELIVNGLMMAKRFTFERTVPSTRGSEQIIYDGRLIANPPPGLQDLTAALPVIREVTP